MNPILSIVIPTRNRGIYCIEAIKSILSIPDQDFELVVQDNSDNLILKELVEKCISDNRLLYNFSPQPLSSIENFNIALGMANGKYVCLIGDDDGVIPEILKVTRWANSRGIESVCSNAYIGYAWPGVYKSFNTGAISLPIFKDNVVFQKPLRKLPELLKNGFLDYYKFNLPRVYHGIVKKSCLEEIKNKTGRFIGGLSPDIYSTVALSAIVEKHVILNVPFTISGVCNSSTSADSSRQKHCGSLEDAPHLRNTNIYNWEPEIPKYYSVETIWSETGIKSLKENTIPILLELFSLEKMVAASLISSHSIKKLIFEKTRQHLKNKKVNWAWFFIKVVVQIFLTLARLIPKKINNARLKLFSNGRIIYNIPNISQAKIKLGEIICHEKYNFLDNI